MRLARYNMEMGGEAGFTSAIAHLDVILTALPGSFEDYYLRGKSHRSLGQIFAKRGDAKAAEAQFSKTRADFGAFLRLNDRLPPMNPQVKDADEVVNVTRRRYE